MREISIQVSDEWDDACQQLSQIVEQQIKDLETSTRRNALASLKAASDEKLLTLTTPERNQILQNYIAAVAAGEPVEP